MKMWAFAKRNAMEILRDPLNLFFGLGFPVILLLLLSAIGAKAPVELFEIERLTPGISVFGLSFITLFSATIIARDRSNAFLQRLYATPLSALDFILGYTLPMLPIALAQCAICYAAALAMGLKFSLDMLYSIVMILPVALVYIALGLLCGSVFTDKQVGGICGALLTNLSAWLSGTWFDLHLVGGAFEKIANALPFVHAVKLEQNLLSGNCGDIFSHFCWVAGYGVCVLLAAVCLFLRQMRKQ